MFWKKNTIAKCVRFFNNLFWNTHYIIARELVKTFMQPKFKHSLNKCLKKPFTILNMIYKYVEDQNVFKYSLNTSLKRLTNEN